MGYDGMTKRDFMAYLYELKGQGLASDAHLYGCLNSECSSSLKSGLVANQFIMMFVLLGLAFINLFAIGLASHTMRFDMHFKSTLANVFIFFALIGISIAGVLVVTLSNFYTIEVNPESLYEKGKIDIPALPFEPVYEESPFYPFVNKFQIQESCEGVTDPEVNCNALDYKIEITATSGTLKL